jgi:hypothetical protein
MKKISEKTLIISATVITILLMVCSWIPNLPVNLISVVISLLGLILVPILIRLFDSFNSDDRGKLHEAVKWINKENKNIAEEDDELTEMIKSDIITSECYWLLAYTAAGFFNQDTYLDCFNRKKEMQSEKQRDKNRIITLAPDCKQLNNHIKNIATNDGVVTTKEKLEIFFESLPQYGQYKQCKSLPSFSLLIFNPKIDNYFTDCTQPTKIYLFIKIKTDGLRQEPVIIIRESDKVLKSFLNYYRYIWESEDAILVTQ